MQPNQITLADLGIKVNGGGWYTLPGGSKVQGKDNLATALGKLTNGEAFAIGQAGHTTIDAPLKKASKVAIIGFTDHRVEAPLTEDWERWGINELYRYMPIGHFTRWFEIHDPKVLEGDKGCPPTELSGGKPWPPHLEAMKQIPQPIYMHEHYDDIPNSIPFPKDEVIAAIPQFGDYQTSSISWMLALAIAEGFEEIGVYGVDMAQETEYFEQRPTCEFLIGVALGRGIKVHIPKTSDLMKCVGQYGFGSDDGFRLKLEERMAWLNSQKAEYQKVLAQEEAAFNKARNEKVAALQNLEGALQDCTYWKRSWSIHGAVDPNKPFVDRSDDPRVNLDKKAE
jgi:hypothetical protein